MLHSDRDLARGAWNAVGRLEPVYLFYGKDYPENIRDRITVRAQETGTTLPAIEITKIIRAIDYLTSRPTSARNASRWSACPRRILHALHHGAGSARPRGRRRGLF